MSYDRYRAPHRSVNLAMELVCAGGERRQCLGRATLNSDVKCPRIRSDSVGKAIAIGCAQRVGALDIVSNGIRGTLDHDARNGFSIRRI